MYKKTKPRSVMELLNKNLSEREAAAILGCSRNTVSEIKELCRQQGMTWDDIQDMTDDGLYDIFILRNSSGQQTMCLSTITNTPIEMICSDKYNEQHNYMLKGHMNAGKNFPTLKIIELC